MCRVLTWIIFQPLISIAYSNVNSFSEEENNIFNSVAVGQTFAKTPISNTTVLTEAQCTSRCKHNTKCSAYAFAELSKLKVTCLLYDIAYDNEDGDQQLTQANGIKLYSKYFPPKRNCHEWYKAGFREHGTYKVILQIKPGLMVKRFVYCYMEEGGQGGGWMAFQRRFNGDVSFARNWQEYKEGFGDPEGEYWLGNDAVHYITTGSNNVVDHDLLAVATAFDGVTQLKKFGRFSLSSEDTGYIFDYQAVIPGYSDYLLFQRGRAKGMKFSTYNADHDTHSTKNCSVAYGGSGGFWFGACYYDHFNGIYYSQENFTNYGGIVWGDWKGYLSGLKETLLLIKLRD